MNGVQLYLREPLPIVHGHVLYIDSPWALTSISQAQFWPSRSFPRDYGDGSIRDCMSIDVAVFDQPGILYGRPAWDLSPRQVVREVVAQMQASLNDTGQTVLDPRVIASWSLDPGLVYRRGRRRPVNEDPLFISTPRIWADRPAATTAIPNLVLAADYVQVDIDTACMEGANQAGRRAANAIVSAAGAPAAPAATYDLYRPPEWEPFRSADERAYAAGLPNALETPVPPASPAGVP